MNAVTQLDQGREALDLTEADMTDPETVLDGTTDHDDSLGGTMSMGDTDEEKEERSKSRETRMAEAGATELQARCAQAIKEIGIFETRRAEINHQVQAVREQLEAVGISKKALAMVVQIGKMNEDELEGFDTAYLILRKAIGQPVQSDMFNFKS
jgi:uncharacterized protein (UPF0335 family)